MAVKTSITTMSKKQGSKNLVEDSLWDQRYYNEEQDNYIITVIKSELF